MGVDGEVTVRATNLCVRLPALAMAAVFDDIYNSTNILVRRRKKASIEK